ncbi:MAG: hypothetical protein OXR66_05350 [Candidatus Woesearchaeota archaeon]|nr:hypothetical protein [Candidatus Woesearchaeota archaeon]
MEKDFHVTSGTPPRRFNELLGILRGDPTLDPRLLIEETGVQRHTIQLSSYLDPIRLIRARFNMPDDMFQIDAVHSGSTTVSCKLFPYSGDARGEATCTFDLYMQSAAVPETK